jgi:hypothetical protein
MSKNDLAGMRSRIATTLARATLLQTQWMQRELRKDRMCARKNSGMHRLAKQFRALKALLRGEERRLLQEPTRKPRGRRPHRKAMDQISRSCAKAARS